MSKYVVLNPFFWWKKRRSIFLRIKESPDDLLWKLIYPFIKRGYIYNPDYEELINLKDKHKGQVGLLLGNGPSVRVEDLESFQKRFVSFACNRIHLAYDSFEFRPEYVLSSDEQMISDFGEEIICNNENVFFVSKRRPFFKGKFIWIRMRNGRPFIFSKEITKYAMVGGGTLISAIQLGYHMGIRRFLLYGVDHSFTFDKKKGKGYLNAVGEGNHFIKNYRSGKVWQAPVYDLVEEAFKMCDKVVRRENGYIINITRGGKLEVLERGNFDEVIKKYETIRS